MIERRHGVIIAIAGIVVLAMDVIDTIDRGSSLWNIVVIATGAFLLFYGFSMVARSGADST